jgi:hypothetical protein
MTTIDLVFTTSPTSTKSCETIPPLGTSDHYGLLTTFSLYSSSPNSLVPRKIWRYKHADFELANDLLSQVESSTIIVNDDVDECWKKWNNAFLRIMEQCIPYGRLPNRKNLPWLSKSIIQLIRKRNFYFKKSKVSTLYTQKYRHARNKVVSLLRSSRKQFFKKLNPKKKTSGRLLKV